MAPGGAAIVSNAKQKMMILEVSTSYLPKVNGTTVTIRNLRAGLCARGHEVTTLTEGRDRSSSFERDEWGAVVRLGSGRGPGRLPLFMLQGARFALKASRSGGADVIHAHGLVAGALALPARLVHGTPFVITFHQEMGRGNLPREGLRSFASGVLTSPLLRLVCALSSRVTAQSERIADAFHAELHIPRSKTEVIPNPVMNLSTPGYPHERAPDSHRVLYVGNLGRNKGVHLLVGAMPRVLRAVPSASLYVVGKGPQRDNLAKLADKLGISSSVHFEGAKEDAAELVSEYLSAAVLVLPSSSEMFGLVLAEALSLGVPVVATKTVGALSIVREDETGTLVEVGDVGSLADAIAWTISNPEKAARMAAAGRADVQRFSIEMVAARYEALFRQAIMEARTGSRV